MLSSVAELLQLLFIISKENKPHTKPCNQLGARHVVRIPGVQQLSADRHFRRDASMGGIVKGHTLRGDPWLSLSSMGMGTYLGAEDAETDELVAAAVITSVQK